MSAKIIRKQGSKLVIEVEMDLDAADAMLDKEGIIRAAVNEAGTLATAEALKSFDADGKPVAMGGRKYTSKGEFREKYECPYGSIAV
ncbi:MAG: ISKra4 family transposase, partial [Victivallaceae bacterium]